MTPRHDVGHDPNAVRSSTSRRPVAVVQGAGASTLALGLRQDLAPTGAVEGLLVARALQAAGRLEGPASRSEADRAERALTRLLNTLLRWRELRPRQPAAPKRPLVLAEAVAGGRSWGVDDDVRESVSDGSSEPWRGRLVCDAQVSERSPVVKGTWVTVDHVVSLVVDGWSWADILRTHPELVEDDLRACLAYAAEEDGTGLAWD